ncbi:MAG: hypothetical protein FJX62_08620 [Alphaproteobacteria bacterium]|nr:hypothetical protein [Alphaproteobacteria bacterium]
MADAVDTFRRISWLIFKWLLYAALAITGLVAAAVAIGYSYQHFTHDRHEAKLQFTVNPKRDSVCKDDKHPIFVGVVNNSVRTVDRVEFTLKANRSGRSSNMARYHSYSDDKIIKPTEGFGNCWAVPDLNETIADPRSLEWGILYKTIRFRD